LQALGPSTTLPREIEELSVTQDRLHFVHMTDTHITARADERVQGQDSFENYRRVLEAVDGLDVDPSFFVITGDLSNAGEPESYERLLALVEETERFGVPVLLGLGNHDSRRTFREVVLGETRAHEPEPYYYCTVIGGLQIVMLDSKVPGEIHGEIDARQLAWLRAQLAAHAGNAGTVICFHHPPHTSGVRWMDDHGLRETGGLLEAISGYNVLGMLHGHTHYSNVSRFGQTFCATGAGVSYLIDPSTQHGMRFVGGAGFNLVSILDGNMVVHPITLPGTQPEVGYLDAGMLASAALEDAPHGLHA
jgi:3',5'-cyclic AMP phosphodiesterase CpdA